MNSVRINETRVESNTNNKSNGDHSATDSRICRKDSRTSKDLPPVPPREREPLPREREPPPREREPPPVPSMESLISRRASSSKNNNEIYSKLRLLPANIFRGSKVKIAISSNLPQVKWRRSSRNEWKWFFKISAIVNNNNNKWCKT